MANPSHQARTFVQSRLLDSETGFNYWIATVAPDYTGVEAFKLANPGTPNTLIIGNFDVRALDQSDDTQYPLAMVYSKRSFDPSLVTPSEFSGPTLTIVDFYLSYPTSDLPVDSESLGDAVEDAMYETFNRQEYNTLAPMFASGLTYNNEMSAEFGQMVFGGDNWLKLARFSITHRYFTNGR